MNSTQLGQLIGQWLTIIIGSIIIGSNFGFSIGVATLCLAYALMPVPHD